MAQRDDIKTASGHAREQNGRFVRFGAGIGKETLLQVARRDLRDLLSKRNDVFGGEERRSVL